MTWWEYKQEVIMHVRKQKISLRYIHINDRCCLRTMDPMRQTNVNFRYPRSTDVLSMKDFWVSQWQHISLRSDCSWKFFLNINFSFKSIFRTFIFRTSYCYHTDTVIHYEIYPHRYPKYIGNRLSSQVLLKKRIDLK